MTHADSAAVGDALGEGAADGAVLAVYSDEEIKERFPEEKEDGPEGLGLETPHRDGADGEREEDGAFLADGAVLSPLTAPDEDGVVLDEALGGAAAQKGVLLSAELCAGFGGARASIHCSLSRLCTS